MAHLDWLLGQVAERERPRLTLRRRAQKLALVAARKAAGDQRLRERLLRRRVRSEVESACQVGRLLQQHRIVTAPQKHCVNKDAELLRTEDAVHGGQVLRVRIRRGVHDEDARIHLRSRPAHALKPAESGRERS